MQTIIHKNASSIESFRKYSMLRKCLFKRCPLHIRQKPPDIRDCSHMKIMELLALEVQYILFVHTKKKKCFAFYLKRHGITHNAEKYFKHAMT